MYIMNLNVQFVHSLTFCSLHNLVITLADRLFPFEIKKEPRASTQLPKNENHI